MFERKIKLKINAEEWKLLRDLLISLRNEQIKRGKSADMINNLIYKLVK